MHPLAERLANGWIAHFGSADREISWTDVEREHLIYLDENTALRGKVDATGITSDGEPFFADWKSASEHKFGRRGEHVEEVKMQWRMNPQALTYGLLCRKAYGPSMRSFTVRWAVKPGKDDGNPSYHFEWYSYTNEELEWWEYELKRIACDVRRRRAEARSAPAANWPVNTLSCLRYGVKYACPFYVGCSARAFDYTPHYMGVRAPHFFLEKDVLDTGLPDFVILGASKVGVWFECQEKFRRLYEGAGLNEESEALTIGSDMHALLENYYKSLKGAIHHG
jgi:hypothetical protein